MKTKFIHMHMAVVLSLLLVSAGGLHAATIQTGASTPLKPQLSMASVSVHHEFKMQYDKDETLACGAVLTFTDGSPEQNIVVTPPQSYVAIDKTYSKGGFFQVVLGGKAHSGLQPCIGTKVAEVAVEDVRPKANPTVVVMPAISGLMVSGGTKPGEPTSVKVLGHGQCKYHVNFGDGRSTDRDEMLPTNLDTGYSISSYGNKTFNMTVSGVSGKCQGSANANVTLMGPGVPAAGAGPAKPLQMSTTKPDLKLSCPPGKRC